MPNSEQKVQECDATEDDSSTAAGLIKNFQLIMTNSKSAASHPIINS